MTTTQTKTTAQVVRYGMTNSMGGHNLGVTVLGVTVLINATEANQAIAEEIAAKIAALGPSDAPEVAKVETPAPARKPELTAYEAKREARKSFQVGQAVRCNVHGAEGIHQITEIGTRHHSGEIKVSNVRGWCPISNFDPAEAR